ncbi:MAG TPA: MurR/RpiR family transcriptional regulator [Providencia sp.]|uniref:MurR/RpiR family transcriptional regulator n=1 Tax=Providencia sp. TaxID=589 RepID=UPI000E8D45EB|nr:MurR/RpiR family transcriptional regulator [Providencia sp.]HBO22400.1 MurR/RpiR family transcriptional regulator [Providencia sp.]
MSNRLASLVAKAGDLTKAEYRILSFLTHHPEKIGQLTIRELAALNYVSTTTIMRLCKKLDFSGYSELIYYCKQQLANPQKERPALSSIENRDPLFSQFQLNYQNTQSLIPDVTKHAFIKLINEQNAFFIYGAGFSHIFAQYISKRLQLLGKEAFLSGLSDSKNIFINNASRYSVFLAVSRSGETEQVLEKVRIAKTIGMTVVAFTRASANSLASMSDLHFPIYDDAVSYHNDTIEISSFESNLVMMFDLLLLQALS